MWPCRILGARSPRIPRPGRDYPLRRAAAQISSTPQYTTYAAATATRRTPHIPRHGSDTPSPPPAATEVCTSPIDSSKILSHS